MEIGDTVICVDDDFLAPFLLKDSPRIGDRAIVVGVVESEDEYGTTHALKLRTAEKRYCGQYSPRKFRVLQPEEMKELEPAL